MESLRYHQQTLLFVVFLLLCLAAGLREYSRTLDANPPQVSQ